MLVGDRMSKPVITVPPEMPINEALNMMKKDHIRRAPVLQNGKLIGIVSDKDLLNASPSPATTLSVWEMNYLLSKITVKDVMTKKVMTVLEDTPIEEAARILADNKIGGMPVMRGDKVVGMITETDLFKMFLELMGAREKGVRVTFLIEEKPGQLAAISKAVADLGGNFVAFGQFAGEDHSSRLITFKVQDLTEDQVRKIVETYGIKLVDLRLI
jgi:acetoin utilization protein AcuB